MKHKIFTFVFLIFIIFITASCNLGPHAGDMAVVKEIFEINGYDTKNIKFAASPFTYWNHKTQRLRILYIPGQFTINKFPKSVSTLDSLERLSISSKKIVSIGNEICSIPALRSLELGAPDLEQLPSEIGRLSSLVRFKLNKTKVTSLPESFSRLDKLENLVLFGRNLTSLPEPVFGLKGLKKLEIEFSETQPVHIDSRLGNMKTLESISLVGLITNLPKELQKLNNLKQLIVFGGEFDESTPPFFFPAELYNLKKLEELHLIGCALHSLPVGINKMDSLKVLTLESNFLRGLPEDIYSMERWAVNDTEEYHFSVYFNYICNVPTKQKEWLMKSDAWGRTEKRWPVNQFCH